MRTDAMTNLEAITHRTEPGNTIMTNNILGAAEMKTLESQSRENTTFWQKKNRT